MLLPIGTCIIHNFNKFDWQYGFTTHRKQHYIIGYIIGYDNYYDNYCAIYIVQDRSNGKVHMFYTDDECIEIYYN